MALAFPRISRRKERLAKIKDTTGVFIYDGSHEIEEHTPTPLKVGKKEPVFTSDGMPLMDNNGRQIYQTPGRIVTDMTGKAVMGGPPKVKRQKLENRTIWGVEFVKGVPTPVDSIDLAIKLRSMPGFKEVASTKQEDPPDLDTIEGLMSLTKAEMLEIAKERGLSLDVNQPKKEIAEAIIRAKGE